MGNFKYGDLGFYCAIVIVTINLFFIPEHFKDNFLWIQSGVAILWMILAIYDRATKVRYLKKIIVPRRMLIINKIILNVFVCVFLFCIFYSFRATILSWMGFVYWFLLGAMTMSRIMVGIDWKGMNMRNM